MCKTSANNASLHVWKPVMLIWMCEGVYLCIEGNHYQSLQWRLGHMQLDIALFVCSSGQEFPDLLTQTEPSVGCMRNTHRFSIVAHRASVSTKKKAIVLQRAEDNQDWQAKDKNYDISSFSSQRILRNFIKNSYQNDLPPSFDLAQWIHLWMCTGGYLCACRYVCVFVNVLVSTEDFLCAFN